MLLRLIVGLGNPGKEYAWSRHNLGFMLIDRLAEDAPITVSRRDCHALVGTGEVEGQPVKLVKPQTFMNLSGEAVECLLGRQKTENPAGRLIVISDDLALPFGKVRIRERGSAGGHNGLKSIIARIGTQEFVRLRIGIQPDHPISNAKRFVLDSFAKSERGTLNETLDQAAQAIHSILGEGVLSAMTKFN
ncbi:MAG: aminoacyl-tRNA hydrolase [Pyrinomonadaceae bacterium]